MGSGDVLSLKNFFYILKRGKKIIIIITMLVTLISGIINFFLLPPIYEAKTTIIIGKTEEGNGKVKFNYDDAIIEQGLMKTYVEIASSDTVANKTIGGLDSNVPLVADGIKKCIKVTFKEGSPILNISVQREVPEETIYITNTFLNSFIEESSRFIPNGKIQVMDKATLPKEPIKPKKSLNIIICFLIGLMSSVGIVFVIEYLDNTVKDQEIIEKYLGLPVIGVIPKNFKQLERR